MFEKFTEKAINVVKSAQIYAIEYNHEKIYLEHLLLAVLNDSSSIIVKTFSINKINIEDLKKEIIKILNKRAVVKPVEFISFSDSSKEAFSRALEIAKILGGSYVKPEHIFLAVWDNPKLELADVLKEKGADPAEMKSMFYNILASNKMQKAKHPEAFDKRRRNDRDTGILSLLESADKDGIFSRAIAKLAAAQYEILGTEQIMLSILEDKDSAASKILAESGVTPETFSAKLAEISSRQAEFGDKQIIFTPNAMKMLITALDTIKEDGIAELLPEHIISGLLKSKKGIAYNILKELNIKDSVLEEKIKRSLEKQANETLYIMRIAKQEAHRLGSNIAGSELILLGIVLQADSIAAEVLRDLGINAKDVRDEVQKITCVNDDYTSSDITFSQRAKLILEDAWNNAKAHNKTKTSADDLLTAICCQPDSAAMKILNRLGTDALEIKQGIKNRLEQERI